jgi:hypothetical protein
MNIFLCFTCSLTVLGLVVFPVSLSAQSREGESSEASQRSRRTLAERENPPTASPLMRALDADKNGELSPAEIENAPATLKTLDKNKDGKLTAEELRPRGTPRGTERERITRGPSPEETVARVMAMDRNQDGQLTKDEVPERIRSLISRADENGDGIASRAELLKLAEKDAAARSRGGTRE